MGSTMETSVEALCNGLARSRLLPAEEVRKLHRSWLDEAGAKAGDIAEFSRWVVARRYVTEYQLGVVQRGHGNDLFLDQYTILERVGKGRMAGVYKAIHRLGPTVAIKILPPSKARDPQTLARFQREARMALALKHPNVVRTFEVGEANGLQFLVMEYLEGETLEDVLRRRGKLPPAEAVRLVYQALLGLNHLHDQGLVHRDLKPANLMLVPLPGAPGEDDGGTRHRLVKIVDIGTGRALFADDVTEDGKPFELTNDSDILGTPDYMAPEQARDAHTADIRADIYSLGCVLYRCLAGQPPFPDANLVRKMIRHATEAPRPLKEFSPEVPDGLQQIVDWMLAKDPARRYPTPDRAASALRVFLAAGSELADAGRLSPQMRDYLEWVESRDGGTPAAPPAPAPVPEARLLPGGRPGRPAPGPDTTRRPRREPAPTAKPKPAPAKAEAQEMPVVEVDVEPVPMAPEQEKAEAPASRGWVVWVIVLVAVLLLGLLLVCGGGVALMIYLVKA
jgi:eukaryotic-like serine/threonine-protein kinase